MPNSETSTESVPAVIIITETVTVTEAPVEPLTTEDFIKARLRVAEEEWLADKEARNTAEARSGSPGYTPNDEMVNGKFIWDYLYPAFNCPYMTTRVGRVGDGGKWVCGMRELALQPTCTIYSFGIGHEYTFEEQLLKTAPNCQLRMFDPTIFHAPLTKYGSRANFTRMGLVANETGYATRKTLKTIMEKFGDKYIDILKVDVEGHEITALWKVLSDFPEGLPFGQLQVEIHAHNFEYSAKDYGITFDKWRDALEDAGLRTFHTELNLIVKSKLYMEVCMLNVKADIFRVKD
jgi:hypothetical protein